MPPLARRRRNNPADRGLCVVIEGSRCSRTVLRAAELAVVGAVYDLGDGRANIVDSVGLDSVGADLVDPVGLEPTP
jgi:hypothetical protein